MEEHNPAVALFLALALIILASRVGGALSRRIGQPRVLGELVAGVILGPTVLNLLEAPIFHGIELTETITEFGELGVLFLMFMIGLEVNLSELARVGRVAILAGIAGALLPVALTIPVVMLFDFGWQPAVFAGVTLAATSVSISAQVLLELGVLRSRVGNALLATALIDDVLAILLVSITVAVVAGEGTGAGALNITELVVIVLRMAAFIAVAGALAWFGLPRLLHWLDKQPSIQGSYGLVAVAIILMLLFAWGAEEFGGVATITGAFIAGLGIGQTRKRIREEIADSIASIAYSLLVPIFFINVGLSTDLSTFTASSLPLAAALLAVALISKVGGCAYGARLGGFNATESRQLSVCMISRGEVGLIIGTLGLTSGVFSPTGALFASLFLVILLTTVATPILVRQIFPKEPAPQPRVRVQEPSR